MSSGTTYPEIDQRAGTSTTILISVIETSRDNFYIKSFIHISCQRRQSPAFLSNFMVSNKSLSMSKIFMDGAETKGLIGQHIKSLSRSVMAPQECKFGSRFTLIVGRETTLLKAKSAGTLVGMETIHAENVLLGGHINLKKLTMGFIVCLRWAIIIFFFLNYCIPLHSLLPPVLLKVSFRMSSIKSNWPVWVLPRMSRISKPRTVSKTLIPNTGLIPLYLAHEHCARTTLNGLQLI